MKRYTKEPWFGNKKKTWGMRPVSWHGWFVSTIFVVALVGLMVLSLANYQDVWTIEIISLIVILSFILTAYLSSDHPKKQNYRK